MKHCKYRNLHLCKSHLHWPWTKRAAIFLVFLCSSDAHWFNTHRTKDIINSHISVYSAASISFERSHVSIKHSNYIWLHSGTHFQTIIVGHFVCSAFMLNGTSIGRNAYHISPFEIINWRLKYSMRYATIIGVSVLRASVHNHIHVDFLLC